MIPVVKVFRRNSTESVQARADSRNWLLRLVWADAGLLVCDACESLMSCSSRVFVAYRPCPINCVSLCIMYKAVYLVCTTILRPGALLGIMYKAVYLICKTVRA